MADKTALVTGAGGFIGHHLVRHLVGLGYQVRGVDVKRPEFGPTDAHEFLLRDLREEHSCREVTAGVDEVYQLAADMGGIGYITAYRAHVARNNVLINAHMLESSARNGVGRYFYSSSACVYPAYRQDDADVTGLREEHASPAEPEEGYGWEKLYSEKLCQYYTEEGLLDTRVARFHNIYGPEGTYDGGREKAPAALCRKVALSTDGVIDIWGDGLQTRSFTYVDDCVEGIVRIMRSAHPEPVNLGTEELVTIDQLAHLVADAARREVVLRHDPSAPQGVRGRNSDNTRLRATLGWEPSTPLREGVRRTYEWVEQELARAGRLPRAVAGAGAR